MIEPLFRIPANLSNPGRPADRVRSAHAFAPATTRTTRLAAALGVIALGLPGAVLHAQFGPSPVVVAPARVENFAPTVSVSGTVFSRDDARLSVRVDGQLTELAEIGMQVRTGDAVAVIDNPFLPVQIRTAEAEVARAQSRVAFLTREVGRLAKLAASSNAARRELDANESDLAVSTSELETARAALQRDKIALQLATLRAPFDGQVTEQFAKLGEFQSSGTEVLRLLGTERLEAVARAPLKTLRNVTPGSTIRVSSDALEGQGVIRTLVPYGSAASHMYEIRVDLDAAVWAVAENVRLAVPQAAAEQHLVVPRDALVLRRDGAAVFRIGPDQTAQRVEVVTGISDGPMIAVQGGLSAGDLVVVRGAERLAPGQAVEVRSPADDLPGGVVGGD